MHNKIQDNDASRSGGLILRGVHRKSKWYWHTPLRTPQVINLFNYFRSKPGNPNN